MKNVPQLVSNLLQFVDENPAIRKYEFDRFLIGLCAEAYAEQDGMIKAPPGFVDIDGMYNDLKIQVKGKATTTRDNRIEITEQSFNTTDEIWIYVIDPSTGECVTSIKTKPLHEIVSGKVERKNKVIYRINLSQFD